MQDGRSATAGPAVRGARRHLRAVAYRMLGSLAEGDNAVQEAWLRLSRADTDDVANLAAWLTTVTGRICLDMLRSRTARREESLDVRLPDPVISDHDSDPEHEALTADAVGLALLFVLETLTPAERLAFVLHDLFGVPFTEIAPIVSRTPEAARMLASRARRRVRSGTAEPDADPRRQREGVDAFRPPREPGLHRAGGTARSQRCLAGRHGPRGTGRLRAAHPGRSPGSQARAAVLPARGDPAARAGQRHRGRAQLARRPADRGAWVYGRAWQDRRDRRAGRPGAAKPARGRDRIGGVTWKAPDVERPGGPQQDPSARCCRRCWTGTGPRCCTSARA